MEQLEVDLLSTAIQTLMKYCKVERIDECVIQVTIPKELVDGQA